VVFLPGTLIVEGLPFAEDRELAARLARHPDLANWPVIVLVDDSKAATVDLQEFLWTFFTRFEPAADIHGREATVARFHVGLTPPIVFDCRMKPWYPEVLEVDPATRQLVDAKIGDLLPAMWR